MIFNHTISKSELTVIVCMHLYVSDVPCMEALVDQSYRKNKFKSDVDHSSSALKKIVI